MEKRTTQKIGSLILFIFLGTVSITGFYYIGLKLTGHVSSFGHFLDTASPAKFFNDTPTASPIREHYVLRRGIAQSVAKARFNYRGVEGRTFLVDVTIPEFDPEAVYRYRLDIDQAYEGFRIGGIQFELIAASRSALRLKRLST